MYAGGGDVGPPVAAPTAPSAATDGEATSSIQWGGTQHILAYVAAGLGVTTLPGLCLRAARHPGIRATPLPGARRQVFAMTYGDPPDPPTTARLIDVLALAADEEPPAP